MDSRNRDEAIVLVVDDVEAQRYAVSRSLKAGGLEVLEAASGAEALEKVKTNPDVVVLDVKLPDISGFEVCRRIKDDARTAHIPVIFVSAIHQNGSSRAEGEVVGATAYLFHPVDPDTLLTCIRAAKARRDAASEVGGGCVPDLPHKRLPAKSAQRNHLAR
ncbi:MAG TPA: response regulator [Candidatus Nanoarchaeia archaeon]|nr:response regulator [Candidatus Nanoarchaeia archaeon]